MTTERPILFSAPMVRAILAGAKTQTRRLVKPQPPAEFVAYNGGHAATRHVPSGRESFCWSLGRSDASQRFWPGMREDLFCPYGQPGDRLCVREAHLDLGACYLFRADFNAEQERDLVAPGQRWRSSIHMPRSASRITLEITEVRVERLQDIGEADARAEGVDCIRAKVPTDRDAYRMLWEDIHGPGAWHANPWVWVVSFRRVGS